MAKGLYILVGVLPNKHLDRVLGVLGVRGDSSNLKRRLVVGRNFCAATLNPVLSLFIDLNTELTLRFSVSRFLATVLTATCHTCELQFRTRGLLRTDFLAKEYGHSSSNLSRICRWMSDSTMHSVSVPGLQHSALPMKLNRRRIMTTKMGIRRCLNTCVEKLIESARSKRRT